MTEGRAGAHQKIASGLIEQVTVNGPGVTLDKLVRPKRDFNMFKSTELSATSEDRTAHGGTDYFQSAFAQLKPSPVAEPLIEALEEIA